MRDELEKISIQSQQSELLSLVSYPDCEENFVVQGGAMSN